jgi:hypothetical protein
MTLFVWNDYAIAVSFVEFLRSIGEYKLAMSLELSFNLLNDTTEVVSKVEDLFNWADDGVNPFWIHHYGDDISGRDTIRSYYVKGTMDIISVAVKKEQKELPQVWTLLVF